MNRNRKPRETKNGTTEEQDKKNEKYGENFTRSRTQNEIFLEWFEAYSQLPIRIHLIKTHKGDARLIDFQSRKLLRCTSEHLTRNVYGYSHRAMSRGYKKHLSDEKESIVFPCNRDYSIRALWRTTERSRKSFVGKIHYLKHLRDITKQERIGLSVSKHVKKKDSKKRGSENQPKKIKLSCLGSFIPGHILFEDLDKIKNVKYTYYSDGYSVCNKKKMQDIEQRNELKDPGVKIPLVGTSQDIQTHFNHEQDLLEYLEISSNQDDWRDAIGTTTYQEIMNERREQTPWLKKLFQDMRRSMRKWHWGIIGDFQLTVFS